MPIGFLTGATLLDLVGGRAARPAAQRLLAAGVLAVAPTAATGLADWSELGDFRRPRRIGLVHASANAVTTLVYAASWRARARGDHGRGVLLGLLGSAGLVVGGYLGGHLSCSEGVGVNRNADRSPEPADWTDAGPAADVAEGGLRRVEVDGQPVLLTRRGDEVLAIGAVCSHCGAPLEDGELTDGGSASCARGTAASSGCGTGRSRAGRPPRPNRRSRCARTATACRCGRPSFSPRRGSGPGPRSTARPR